MKKALPILWRYLLVVAVSCALAFYASQPNADHAKRISALAQIGK